MFTKKNKGVLICTDSDVDCHDDDDEARSE